MTPRDPAAGMIPIGAAAAAAARLSDYAALAKVRLSILVLATAAAGYFLGLTGPMQPAVLLHVLIGTALTAFGASALNQVLEQHADARMRRTSDRPIPSGRVSSDEALLFGAACGAAGVIYLLIACNPVAAALAAVTLLLYVLVYTPLKRRTPLSLPVGAIPGAMPPLIGFAAARGGLAYEAWLPALIVFFWQHPHFLAISWMHRDDYARGGFAMLCVNDPDGRATSRQALARSLAMSVAVLLPAAVGAAGAAYALTALLLSAGFVLFAAAFCARPSRTAARRLFLASLVYLPILLLALVLNRAGS